MPVHQNPRDREQSQLWAQQMLALPNFYVFDTETTGVGQHDQIVQIGVLDKLGNKVLETLVKPTIPVPSGAIAVHGITNEKLVDAPTFMDVYITLSAKLAGATLIAYNMDFDWRMLEQSARPYGLPLFRIRNKYCAMKQYAAYYGSWNAQQRSYRWQKLGDACKQQKISVLDAHNAVGDARMTLALLRRMGQ